MKAVRRMAILVGALAMVAGALGSCEQQSVSSGASATPAAPQPSGASSVSTADSPTTPLMTTAGPTARTISITVRDGQASGDTGRVEVALRTPVILTVTSDVADEIHVHGYEREAVIPAGGTGSVSFTVDIPGVFEVELHESGLRLLQLQVS